MDNQVVFRICRLFFLATVSAFTVKANAQTVEYIHTDALGTPVAITDSVGNIVERSEYEPYGQLVNRALTDGPGFTGHVQDAATGLTYMQQRYYDPIIGRFLSADPVGVDTVLGGNFNRFYYVDNNPYRYFDPDGRHKQDRWYGHNERDFQRFAHEVKNGENRTNDFTKEELDRLKEEWKEIKEKRKERQERDNRRRGGREGRNNQRGSINPIILLRLTPAAFTWSVITFIPEANSNEDQRLIEFHQGPVPTVTVGSPETVDSTPDPEQEEPPPPCQGSGDCKE